MKLALATMLLVAALPALAQGADDAAHRADRARDEYRHRLAAWRARVAACEAGRTDACE